MGGYNKKYRRKSNNNEKRAGGGNRIVWSDRNKIIAVAAAAFGIVVIFFVAKMLAGGAPNSVQVLVTNPASSELSSRDSEVASTIGSGASTSEATTESGTSTDLSAESDSTASSEAASSGAESSQTSGENTAATEPASATTETASATTVSTSTEASTGVGSAVGGFYNDIKVTDTSLGILVLCNKNYRLPDSYEAENLEDVPSNYYVNDGKEYKMSKPALDAFIEMSDAAYAQNNEIDLRVVSGYRSKSYQEWLYNHYANSYGQEDADTYSARPRHSEHETGLCCDINIVSVDFENTAAFEWLMANAADYGFILRYPKGKEHITGYIYEPWHWRYVGVETAKAVVESGLTYDEYFLKYIGE